MDESVGAARSVATAGPANLAVAVAPDRWSEVVAWLDAGLRRGERGRLQAEYPISLRLENAGDQFLISEGSRPLSHAMLHRVTARVGEISLRLGLISLVFTEENARGRGLAGVCVRACVAQLRREGTTLAMLWSDRHGFYERLGFHPAGRERFLLLDSDVLQRASAGFGPALELDVELPRQDDWQTLECLYAARRLRTERRPGDLALLAAGPEVTVRVARDAGRPVAYAALGRGDDFADVVHEWAGEETGVLACLRALQRGRSAIGLMASAEDEELIARLRRAGASEHGRVFALMCLLDPSTLWNEVRAGARDLAGVEMTRVGDRVRVTGGGEEVQISEAHALSLLLDGETAAGLGPLAPALTAEERIAFAEHVPLPLYLWGFDSI